jgi:hypothetical protein
VSLLAPFIAALVGAVVGLVIRGEAKMRVFGPLAVLAGAATEIAVLSSENTMSWLKPVLVLVAATAAVVLANPGGRRWRSGAIATALAVLMLAPASWAVQTLGHATSSTFPAGGPASTGFGGGGGPGGGRGFGGPPGGAGGGQLQAPPSGGAAPTGGAAGAGGFGGAAGGGRFGGGGGGFGGDNSSAINAALSYAKAHGGGAVAVSSQSGASGSIINSGADVVAIGGFSGRESQVTISWFAQQVASGKIRWVIADSSGGGMPTDSRVGSKDVMTAITKTCKAVKTSAGTIYDCQGSAAALAKLA